jgi:hypothetical protein
MRSSQLSRHHPKASLQQIFSYGLEALTNRRKNLFLLSFWFIFLPQLMAVYAFLLTATSIEKAIADTSSLAPLDQFMSLFNGIGQRILLPSLVAGGLFFVGMLSLARTSVDYFESKPESIPSAIMRSMRVLLTKGLGAGLMLIIITPALTLMPLLRAIGISMLLMLPVTLVASSSGGFKSTWDTLWLRYTSPTAFGRWPVFVNVLSVTGLFISLFFLGGFLIEKIPVLDTIMGTSAGFLEKNVAVLGGVMNAGWLIAAMTGLIWEAGLLAVMMPFLASVYHLTTTPEGHTPFQAEA